VIPTSSRQAETPASGVSLDLEYALQWRILLRESGGECRLLASDSVDPQVLDEIAWATGRAPEVERISAEELQAGLEHRLREDNRSAADLIAELDAGSEGGIGSESDLRSRVDEAPVVRLVNLLLSEALESRASDVHLESERGTVQVRYRIDGTLVNAPALPASLAPAVVGRLKVMASLDIAERRRPQDGRVRVRLDGRPVDVRVSTLPTLHGESVVLRLLGVEGQKIEFDGLGMGPDTCSAMKSLLARPHGVLLATGPTGSGKTTTLYAALVEIRTGREKIVTVEDPVEYALDGITQVPVNRKAGVTFASALRSILRQDPDVMLVGEMRDVETAQICVQAALTGHLVLSTLHTNDAPSALVRLVDLEVEPYLVASTVEGVLAQRLVRRNCLHCLEHRAPDLPIAREMEAAGFPAETIGRSQGCTLCRNTGFRGRTGIYELLMVTDELRTQLLRRDGARALRQLALEQGMRPLRADGWRQVAAGVTSPEEVLRVASH
jgi:general secretion pathway protein E